MAGVVQWIELWPTDHKVAGLIPSQAAWVSGQVTSRGRERGN